MPHEVCWEDRGVYVRYSGLVTDQEIAGLARGIEADLRFSDLRHVIHDFLDCVGTEYSVAGMQELSAVDSAAALSNPKVRIAVVNTREDVNSLVQAYQQAGFPGFELRQFASLGLARAWLA